MFDERFSATCFIDKAKSIEAVKELSKILEEEIQIELHKVIDTKLKEIIGSLNKLGHNLTLYEQPTPGDISYRDNSSGKCLLRVASDNVISVGYSDTVSE